MPMGLYSKKFILLVLCLSSCRAQKETLEAHLAGSWYSAQRAQLSSLIQSLEKQAEKQFDMHIDDIPIRAIIVPHAGYTYSGIVAAAAYRLLAHHHYDRAIIIGPSHYYSFHGIAVPSATEYIVPTGTLKIDTHAVKQLAKTTPLYQYKPEVFAQEHSVEIQLPLVLCFIPQAAIIPLVIGNLDSVDFDTIIASLRPFIDQKTVVIISSDFLHHGTRFGYTPFKDAILLRLRQLDSTLIQAIERQRCHTFTDIIQHTGATVCGCTPIALLLAMIERAIFGRVHVHLVGYDSSERVTHSTEDVVTYASLVVTAAGADAHTTHVLNAQEKNSLLRYARDTLMQAFDHTVDSELIKPILTPALQESHGVFVTLYTKQKSEKSLRGCVGLVTGNQPIYQSVAQMALAAAFHDTRFAPLSRDELDTVQIEISILMPPRSVPSYKDIILNKHGIILTQGHASALFLPKVPQEFGFDMAQTLTALSQKADLPADAWRDPKTTFKVFEAIDFKESHPIVSTNARMQM
jgi:AmmeMemoRadiSam system protein B/AmmeMemoRadiSam system protein A